ncbi:zinc finger protein 92-like isoform X2 [Plodia interpunctella]|uniref:zinc finger protein 92-like isoform X2 n=1 Tax=Plodia interpunctella TaxID=58824 RepID=UPI002367D5DE|nr:zinc finger protein 92-like isoform X2 [Plodia interpunctella]
MSTIVCCGCLNSDRKLTRVEEFWKSQYFTQIINEVMMSHQPSEPLHLCYECDALLTKFVKFKQRVKHSYSVLCDYSQKNINIIDPKPSVLTLNHNIYNIALLPDSNTEEETMQVVKHEVAPKIELDAIKEEDRVSVYSDHHEDDTPLTELKKKKKVKLKKDINKKIEMYREVELSLEELEEERRMLALKDEFVNAMFRCNTCIMSFPNADDLGDHVKMKHELHASHHKCKVCECSFGSEFSFNYHWSKHTRRYECCACALRCRSKRDAARHYDLAHCWGPEIPYNISKIDKNDGPEDSSRETYPCEFCHKTFKWKTSLRKHLETHKIEMGEKRKPYCEPCRLSFTTTSNLQKHVKTSSKHQMKLKLRKLQDNPSSVSEQQTPGAQAQAQAQYRCPHCERGFQWRGNLQRHLASHAARANGSLVCTPCNRTFSSIATFKQHMAISKKHVSEEDYKYMCSSCGKRFAIKSKLKDHIDWEHLKIYTHTCTVCQKPSCSQERWRGTLVRSLR